jgi:signal peptidase II
MKYLKPTLLVVFILIVDQVTKYLVKTRMHVGEEINVAGNWFIIHFTENNGMAFGLEFEGMYGKLLLTLFRIVAVFGIIWYLRRLIKTYGHPGLILSVACILAGAAGNIIDSVFYGVWFDYAPLLHGRVVDMLYFPVIETHYPDWFPVESWRGQDFVFFRPVFNIADTAISIGVITILIFQKSFFKETPVPAVPEAGQPLPIDEPLSASQEKEVIEPKHNL